MKKLTLLLALFVTGISMSFAQRIAYMILVYHGTDTRISGRSG